MNIPAKSKSIFWYLIPILFQIIGGAIVYFILRNSDSHKAKISLILGIVLTVINFGVGELLRNFDTLSSTPWGQYAETYGVAAAMVGPSLYIGVPIVVGYYIFDSIKKRKNRVKDC